MGGWQPDVPQLAVLCLIAQLCPTLCDPMDCSRPGSSVHGDSLGKNTGVGCHALLQGIFPTQGLNPGLPHCKQIIYQLSYQGNPYLLWKPSQVLGGKCHDTMGPLWLGPPGAFNSQGCLHQASSNIVTLGCPTPALVLTVALEFLLG